MSVNSKGVDPDEAYYSKQLSLSPINLSPEHSGHRWERDFNKNWYCTKCYYRPDRRPLPKCEAGETTGCG